MKLITNDASKNADNKEIARLKEVSLEIHSILTNLICRANTQFLALVTKQAFQKTDFKNVFLYFLPQIIAKMKKGEAVEEDVE